MRKISRRTFGFASLAGAITLAAPGIARGQSYPSKPIRVIVPFGASGSSDISARLLSNPLQQLLGQPVIVENRPGAGSNIGTVAVARSDPDGYTLLLTSSAFVVNPTLYAKPAYDAFKQFVALADIADAHNVLLTSPKSGFKSLKEVIDHAKAHPGKLNVASPGLGTTPHLSIELLRQRAGIDVTPIPYQGGGPAAQAMLGGQTDLFFSAMPNIYSQLVSGTMVPLAIAAETRWPGLPNVATFIESGFPNFLTSTGHLLLAPAGTPTQVVDTLADAAKTVLARPEIREHFVKLGYSPVGGGAEIARRRIAHDIPFYGDIIKKAKLQIE